MLQFYIQTRKFDSMLHSLTSRQNAKYSSSSVQKGRAVHTLQGERALIVRKAGAGLNFARPFDCHKISKTLLFRIKKTLL